MARKINSRLIITGVLQAETPLHVGGYGIDVETDLPLARNGKGDLYIPGTSLTGALRAWCERNFGDVNWIFGYQDKNQGHASFVLIEDAIVNLPKDLSVEIRDGVSLDRIYGTAAAGSKFDRAILPKDSALNFEMTVEIGKDDSQIKAVVGHMLSALTNREIRFGASKTRGLGRVKFDLTEIREEKFNSFDAILALFDDLKKDSYSIQDLIDADVNKIPKLQHSRLEIEIEWQPVLPLMNKAGYEGIGVDMLPVTSGAEGGKVSLLLAGSSIKGAFRSHAERIMRTLLDSETKNALGDQLIVPIVQELFGAKKEKDKKDLPKSKFGLGALSIDDCYSVEKFDQTEWSKIEQGTVDNETSADAWEISRAITGVQSKMTNQTKVSGPHFHISHHNAIDRFTGGASDSALYSVLAPHNIEWQAIKMTLDFGRTHGKEKCCLMLLLLVLRDLTENRLPLGFAVNRGMGEVSIEKIEIKGDYEITWKDGKFAFADENQKIEITEEWQKCLA